jgi:uncharacterized protein YjbI with pentapeptide repeats
MSSASQLATGFVRPRFDDGTFDEPLPLEDHVLERVVRGRGPCCLVVEGPRGSGLTTLIGWLLERIAAEGVTVVGPGKVVTSGDDACRGLDRREAVLLLDLSPGKLDPFAWGNAEALLDDAVARGWRAVAAAPPAPLHPDGVDVVRVAPWTWDDVIELLGAPRYREHRARLLAALRGLPEAASLLARPRTASRLIEAALALGEGEPATLARLYANVLDTLAPSTLEVLRRLPTGPCSTLSLADALVGIDALDVDEVSALFEASAHLAPCLLHERRAALVRTLAVIEQPGRLHTRFALPGLQHLLQAGDCLARVARDEAPAQLAASWLPYLPELITDAARARLRDWLTDAEAPATRDGQAATILWACGETPPLDATHRPLVLADALLAGLGLPGANLVRCQLPRTDLSGARLEGARLQEASVLEARLDAALLDGADLSRAELQRVSLRGASLRGVRGHELSIAGSDLRGASLEGALLEGATIGACHLEGANLRRVALRGGKLFASPLVDADLSQLDLTRASLAHLDLTRPACFEPSSLSGALLSHCNLAGLDLEDVQAEGLRCLEVELLETRLSRAQLRGAVIERCKAHGARFDGADLRDALFSAVSFQMGSARSGLLIGKPALEGSMTGFYAEGTTDDAWAPPESLRQASFYGADLRGARFSNTNLFRVDLREARLDPEVERQARDQGALLS